MSVTEQLNPEQQRAVEHTEGPVLILAGAGSGKTRVLTQRVAFLIREKHVAPWNILAITFTNKAANEMKERVAMSAGEDARKVFVSTFHACCVRILRQHADLLGYDKHFSVYDSDDSKSLMKNILKQFQLETRDVKLRRFLNAVSNAKDELIAPGAYLQEHRYDRDAERIATAYREYQRALMNANAMDFDDLIMKTVELFRLHPEVLESFQDRFRYICVDEYQDTNNAQFELVRLLAMRDRNLCVVGDDDQSIYRFRGANIRNILDFERVYPDAYVVKLEQNYRSTQHILDAANSVISNNAARKNKALWSDLGDGAKIRLRQFPHAIEEAEFVASDVAALKRGGKCRLSDVAVLYRTNAQSRLIEERFVRDGIPYELVGGVNFYSRREIKDILAYLKTIDNARDELAVRRIINVPKRGIGNTTVEKAAVYAAENGTDLFTALIRAEEYLSGKALEKVTAFTDLIDEMRSFSVSSGVEDLIRVLIDRTGYEEYLISLSEEEGIDAEDNERLKNVEELISKAADYEAAAEDASLSGFLEEVALVADIDMVDDTKDRAYLMTLHAAKGLEFSHVYITGMEEDVFPSFQSRMAEEGDPAAMEEERRLAYVGITRAKQTLTLTCARARMVNGETRYSQMSRFVSEIPEELLDTDVPDAGVTLLNPAKKTVFEKPFAATAIRKQSLTQPKTTFAQLKKGAPAVTEPDYTTGDRVRHVKFGDGTVTAIEKETRDYKVTVDFDAYGTKVMYAMFAKLQKI